MKFFNWFSAIIALVFIWSCANSVFTDYSAGHTGLAALNVVGLVIWVYIFFSSSFAIERMNREEEKKEKEKNEK